MAQALGLPCGGAARQGWAGDGDVGSGGLRAPTAVRRSSPAQSEASADGNLFLE